MFVPLLLMTTLGLVFGLLGSWIWLLVKYAKAEPKIFLKQQRIISVGRIAIWFCLVTGVVLAAGGIWLIWDGSESLLLGCLVTFMGTFFSVAILPSFSPTQAVIWTDDYVEGPCRIFSFKRAKIEWTDMHRSGYSWGYWYVETANKRRIYWHYYYKGYGAFNKAVKQKCPDLKVTF